MSEGAVASRDCPSPIYVYEGTFLRLYCLKEWKTDDHPVLKHKQ